MSHRNLFLAWLLAFSAIALGCRRESANAGMGRLDLMVQPDNGAAGARQVRGTFTLRPLGGTAVAARRVSIATDPYRTLSVPVASGLYSLGWEPERAADGVDAASSESEIESIPSDKPALQPILIAPDQVTLLRIRSTAPSQHDPSARVLASRDPA
jgi:hypothetical protein